MVRARPADGELAATLPARLAAARAADAGSKVAYPIGLRHLTVLRATRLTPGLRRLTLGGDEIGGLQSHLPEEPLRFVLPDAHGELRLPERDGELLHWPRPAVLSREYTVRRHDAVAGELDVDVVEHQGGIASAWAARAEPGDGIHLAGPPGGFVVPDHHERFLFAGDETALPQIARYLETLRPDARGRAVLEVADPDEVLDLTAPPGVEVVWIHRDGAPAGSGDGLERAVREVDPTVDGRVFVWMAGEAGLLRPLRRWAAGDLRIPPGDVRITGYWKRGAVDFDDD